MLVVLRENPDYILEKREKREKYNWFQGSLPP
jgi:hypothetical protein